MCFLSLGNQAPPSILPCEPGCYSGPRCFFVGTKSEAAVGAEVAGGRQVMVGDQDVVGGDS